VRTDHRLLTIDVATEGTASEIFRILGRLQAAGAPADKVSTYRPSLDDVFLSVTATATATGAAVTGRRAAAGAAQAEAHTEAKEMAR
jgi:hypothetical protein